MKSSRTVCDRMKERDAVSWNNILLALGIHGAVDELFASFENMKAVGVKPDKVTFTCVLSACSHAGRLNDGSKYFRSMVKEYGIEAELEQCNCIVDLLGRAGYLKEAHDLILGLPSSDVRIWGSLLGACQIHGNDKLAELVLPRILELDPDEIGYRVLLANLYDRCGRFDDAAEIMSPIKKKGLKKAPGCIWIEVMGKVHAFASQDQSHPQAEDIYRALEGLTAAIAGAG